MRYLSAESSPEDWRQLLADPVKHWVRGRSAWELAHAWENAKGFPPRVRAVLEASGIAEFSGLAIDTAQPELPTPLPGGSRPSYTDLWLLARNTLGSVSIGIEGKVDETFGPLIAEWDPEGTPGRRKRLSFLCDLIGLKVEDSYTLRYQLLHRTAASILEAERNGCPTSLVLVHSFSSNHAWFDDYSAFTSKLGGSPQINGITRVGHHRHIGWVDDLPLTDPE